MKRITKNKMEKKDIFAPLALGLGATRRAAMLLLVMMLTTASAWAQTTITPTTPSQDGDGNYLIGNAAELYGFAEIVNNGNAAANAKLTADIVVNEYVLDANGDANTGDFVQWISIGNDDQNTTYSGTFDGQGHTISGLYVSGSGWYVGFVGQVSGTAVVKNVGIVDSYFSSSGNMLGSIVGGVPYGSSVTLANVYSTSTVKGSNWIGGLVGGDGFGSVTIINSYFAGKTSSTFLSGAYNTHHDDLVSGEFDRSTLTVCNAFVLGTSQYGTSVTAEQLSDGTVAAALHYYQDALADGSIWGISGGKTDFSGTLDGVSVTTANITLHTFDGDATTYSSKYIVGNTTPLPVNVVRDGYRFSGWYDNADLKGDAVTKISSSETDDKEYWAKFDHSVSFVLGGGTIRSGEIDHYIEGETTALPSFVTKNGASFEGWYTTEDFTGDRYYSIPATATEDMTFYAKWGAAKTTFYLIYINSPEPVNVLYEGEKIVWLDKTTMFGYSIMDNQYNIWGGFESDINVPYTGGESTFGNGGGVFNVSQSGFYVFTLTDKGEGNWFVSVLKSMLNCDVASIPTQVYTGSAIEPAVTVKDGETTLTLGTDYEVAYSNNVNAGTATVTITGKGNYSDSKEATFTIAPKAVTNEDITVTIPSQTWTGNELTPVITVKDGENVLTENTDYTVTPPSGPIQDSGNYTYTITGKGNYSDSKEATFTITPYLADQAGAVYVYQDQNGKTALLDGTSVDPVDIDFYINIIVNHVTSNRVFTPGMASTVMLPFNYTCNGEEGGTFYKFVGVEKEGNTWVATMQETGDDTNKQGTLEANTPYLFMPTATGMSFPNINGSVRLFTRVGAVAGNCETADPGSHWTFKGTYRYMHWKNDPEDLYYDDRSQEIGHVYGFAGVEKDDINVGDFVKVAWGAKIRPMRAYLLWNDEPNAARSFTRDATATEELPNRIAVRLVGANGEVTGIGTLSVDNGQLTIDNYADADGWYDLQGRKLSGKPSKSGLYIKNGKKIVIK